MGKGMFTQGLAVLASSAPTLADVERVLADFPVATRPPVAESADSWMGGYPALVIDWRPEVNGRFLVDIVDQPWPDAMGDPQADPELFGAWAMGWFGPAAYPGNLQRALAQSFAWPEAAASVPGHRAFIRLKSSYVLGAGAEAPTLPPNCRAQDELQALTEVARRLMGLSQAVAFFNPGGEVLLPPAQLDDILNRRAAARIPPIDVWTNVRILNPGNGWLVMDTVGMAQLDQPDHEACFPREQVNADDVAAFLRNVSMYVLERGSVINDRDTINGPGGCWRVRHSKDGLSAPARPTLRWFPETREAPPEQLIADLEP